jgi:hypothetical protein
MRRVVTTTLVALIALVPATAWGVSPGLAIEGLYGFARPPAADFRAAVSGTANDRDLSESSLQIAGGTILVNFGAFEVGALIDTTFGDGVTQTAIGGLVGFRLGDQLRLDLLGEIGGHRFGNFADDPSVVTASSSEEWLLYVGLRPGLAYRIEVGEPGGLGFLLGLWGFVRWDVTEGDTPVTVGGAGGEGDVELGGTSIGATLRAGIAF